MNTRSEQTPAFPMRINKYLAAEGITTRRGADELIAAGRVRVNGEPAVVGQKIHENDVVDITGALPEHAYYAFYKPAGVITHSPTANEIDIRALLEKYHITHAFPIGRLDKASEGLMLITTDGRITERLLSPEAEHEKEYEVTVDKKITPPFLAQMAGGVTIEGYTTKPAKLRKIDPHTFTITLTEGKKHQIRRMCAALGYQVSRIKRIRIMHITLGALKPGMIRKLTGGERHVLLHELGLDN